MNIAEKTLSYVKSITAQTISNAGSGHTGSALGASSIMLALFKNHYNFDVSDTDFLNRDRLVVSNGHVSPLYYTLLSMFGFDVSLQDLKNFRKFGSRTPAHPEYGTTNGVEATTGALGQGVANAVGMAIAESLMAERFNSVGFPIIDNYTYCLCGDGDLMEGVAQEACSLAGTLNLNKLILLYDSNDVTIDGNVSLANRESTARKFRAMGWNVVHVKHGNDFYACSRGIRRAKNSTKPTIVIFKTTIGIGTDKEGTSAIHGVALNGEELRVFNEKLGVKESFYIPNDVRDWCMASARAGKLRHEKWNQELAVYSNSNPELYKQFLQYFDRKKFDASKHAKNLAKYEGMSTRDINRMLLNDVADKLPQLLGGTADLAPSTRAYIENSGNFLAGNKRGRNLHFGIREHAMAAIINGIALYEDFIPFCATFLSFANYMLPAIRMSALMKLSTLYFFTHDSVLVGEDGPTHQPIEQLGQLRSIIGLNVFRPCDAAELLAAYHLALAKNGPSAICLSRQNIGVVKETDFKNALQGGYVIKPCQDAEVVIYASGSEVPLAMEVAALLQERKVSVVSMPCLEVFERQNPAYKARVLQSGARVKVAIEASNDNVWYKYIGSDGLRIGIENYGKSGKGDEVYAKLGFSAKEIAKKILKALEK